MGFDMKEVSEAYLTGIRDGREYKERFKPTLFDMREILQIHERTLEGFKSGPIAEHLRGERDFWKHQIEKELEK